MATSNQYTHSPIVKYWFSSTDKNHPPKQCRRVDGYAVHASKLT